MESIINKQEKQGKEKYPCLKISTAGQVVFFTGKERGTVIHVGISRLQLGDNGPWDESQFTPFNGEITLKN